MNIKLITALTLTLVSTLAGCSKDSPPAELPSSTPAAVESPVAPAASLADFSVVPGEVYACEGRDRTVSTVKWRVKDASIATVRIEVDSAQDPTRKTFAAGGASGEAVTGEWVVAGVRFHLVDAASGKELANYEMKNLPCQ